MLFTVLKSSHSEQANKGRGALAVLLMDCRCVPGTGMPYEANSSFPVWETIWQYMSRFKHVCNFLDCNSSFKTLS